MKNKKSAQLNVTTCPKSVQLTEVKAELKKIKVEPTKTVLLQLVLLFIIDVDTRD